MTDSNGLSGFPDRVCHRAVEARDARFDGVFFVAIASTGIYCRPICPSRPADPDNRRFFQTAAAAERAGFRPCLRCRPERAPGRALVDAVSRLAASAAERIRAGALNGRSVGDLASDLHVSERHLRRALNRELGVSPVELAQTHRLLLAKRLLADTSLDIGRVAFASGFQSLRRFNAVVRERYDMTPTAIRRSVRTRPDAASSEPCPFVELTLSYRPPMGWDQVTGFLARHATPGVDVVRDGMYARTVRIGDHVGTVAAEHDPDAGHVRVRAAASLVPVLMPLLSRLRRLFDLDAEPGVIDVHLAAAGLAEQVEARPGVRVPGAFDGFEAAFLTLLRETRADARDDSLGGGRGAESLAARVVRALGEPVEAERRSLDRVMPDAGRVASAGAVELRRLGVPPATADVAHELARRVADGALRLDPADDLQEARTALGLIPGIDERLANAVVMRALHWPDAFPAADVRLQRAAGADGPDELLRISEAWRPWRAYAAMHLRGAMSVSR